MKHPLALALLALPAPAADGDLGVYRVPRTARADLAAMEATVHHGPADRAFTAALSPEQAAALVARGHAVVPVRGRLADDPTAPPSVYAGGWTSYAQMRADFQGYAAAHPAIAEYRVLGLSVQGREIFGLRISDNVAVEEDEPEVAYVGSIHGDEFASGEVKYLYGMYLCDEYGVDPDVTRWVDDYEIWVVPLLNPDGHELGIRNNANGVDLNREFGFQWDGWGGSSAPHGEVETQAVHRFLLDNNVTLAVTAHCSGDVFLYPWGYSPNATPDAGVIQQVGATYASLANYVLLSSWVSYETHGELLDQVYGAHGGLCYTSEMSNSLPGFALTWSRNQAALNGLLDLAGGGLHGLVTDARTGAPVWAAVWVSGNDVPAYTDPTVGDLHRLLDPGTYDLTVWANGYSPATVTGVVVPPLGQPPGTFQVALQPCADRHAFLVTAVNQRDPGNSYANVSPPSAALGAPDGAGCSLSGAGWIVLDLGADVFDGPGDDFTVTEAAVDAPEAYAVYAGDAYLQDRLVGAAVGTASFDLFAAGVASTRYLKIVDRSQSTPGLPLSGFDLDAVTVLGGCPPSTVPGDDVSRSSVPAGGQQKWNL